MKKQVFINNDFRKESISLSNLLTEFDSINIDNIGNVLTFWNNESTIYITKHPQHKCLTMKQVLQLNFDNEIKDYQREYNELHLKYDELHESSVKKILSLQTKYSEISSSCDGLKKMYLSKCDEIVNFKISYCKDREIIERLILENEFNKHRNIDIVNLKKYQEIQNYLINVLVDETKPC